MKLFILAVLLAAATGPIRAADVGVSMSVGQPGFYGRLDLGDYPSPQLIYRQPRMIRRGAEGRPPVYMHVPPGHARNWAKHCGAYNACQERVYFVQDGWYNNQYVPYYQEQNHNRQERRHEGRRNDHRGSDWEDRQRGGNERGQYR